MNIVVDTSVIISVVTNEKHKRRLVDITKGADLTAPASLHWEVGNAFSSMFKRQKMTLSQAKRALRTYEAIAVRFLDVQLEAALDLASKLRIYAYDAYVIQCALAQRSPILTLDRTLCRSARRAGVTVIEVEP
jgi:predicted nucleic acid-binding protein